MKEKGETLSGPMLREKRKRSEYDFGIPDEMGVTDWIASFPPSLLKTYNIKEFAMRRRVPRAERRGKDCRATVCSTKLKAGR